MVDAALVYVAVEWAGPALISAVLALASSPSGGYLLFMIGWPFFVAISLVVGDRLGMSLPANPNYRPPLRFMGRPYY